MFYVHFTSVNVSNVATLYPTPVCVCTHHCLSYVCWNPIDYFLFLVDFFVVDVFLFFALDPLALVGFRLVPFLVGFEEADVEVLEEEEEEEDSSSSSFFGGYSLW